MNHHDRMKTPALAGLLLAGLVSMHGGAALSAPNASFNLVGHIEAFTLANPADPLSRATLTIRGIPVTVPKNLLIVMPGQYLTAQDLFRWNPANHSFAASAQAQSGLALRDSPPPAVPFEAEAIGNIVNGEYIAGVVHISQGGLHMTAGPIASIDRNTSEFTVGAAGAGKAVRVRLNDPKGIYALPPTALDQRFALDPDNSPVHAKTGFPVCIPHNADPDNKCPASNRPAAPNQFRFTCAGTGNPLGPPASPDAPAVNCDPRKPVPLAEGDYVTVIGMLARDDHGDFLVAAHGLDAELGIYTSPGAPDAYVYIEEALQGSKGEPFDVPQEETTRFRIVGFTTDPSRNVEIRLIDTGLDETGTSISGPVGLFPSNGPQLGRFRNTWPAKDDARAVRRDVRAQIVGHAPVKLPSGLTTGSYTAPIGEYIYPEVTRFGEKPAGVNGPIPVPVPFENFCFLRTQATISTLDEHTLGALTPFPASGHDKSQLTGLPGKHACSLDD